MRIIHNLQELGEPLRTTVATVGNFDGVHLAHQQLMRGVVARARADGAVPTAITFDPHPTRLLAPHRALKLLTPLPQKTRLIEALGIDLLVVLPFNRELSHLAPAAFVHKVLVQRLRVAAVYVGPDFRFGHRHAGDVHLLRELARQEGFDLEVLAALQARGQRVSSTRIRELLSEGKVDVAARLLGRAYSVSGPIVPGSGVGQKQTVPTLNLAPYDEQLPAIGVYVSRTRLGGQWHDSATNVGRKPTFGEHRVTVESYLLDFSGEIHEPEMEVEFLFRLRDEVKFPDAAALKAQIQKDARRSLQFFRLFRILQGVRDQGSEVRG